MSELRISVRAYYVTEYVVLEEFSLLAKIYTLVPLVTNLTAGENDRIFYLTYNLYFGDWLAGRQALKKIKC